jgi:hypothetical protein
MSQPIPSSTHLRIILTICVAIFVFVSVYLGAAFYSTSKNFDFAVQESEQHAHTIIGKEGYEYIFEPSTQILIDRIKPNSIKIISYLVLHDYLFFRSRSDCTYPDPFVCNWILIQMNPDLYQPMQPWRFMLILLISGLVAGGGFYLLTRRYEGLSSSIYDC